MNSIHLLPVIVPPVPLCELRIEVDEMACEKEVILGCYGQGVAHECARVDGQGGCKLAGDAVHHSQRLRIF
jgi:hypothetical protein